MPRIAPDVFDNAGIPIREAQILRRVLEIVREELLIRGDVADLDGVCLALAQGLITQLYVGVASEDELLHYAFARVTPTGWLPT